MIHELKIYPEFFHAVACGVKRAELRKNDRNYQVGDTLHLCEFSTLTGRTGEFVNVRVTHIADVGAWLPGYVLLSVELEPVATVKHYTGDVYPRLKFAQNEWSVCGDRGDVQELADAINALATSSRGNGIICHGERCKVCDEMIVGPSYDGLCLPCRDDKATSDGPTKLEARRRRNRQSNARARAKETPAEANQRRKRNRERMATSRSGKR